ncbi:hypothetical protein A2U01_0083593, partial [Trifolium medium]|nr:hypothetical protein [Trifolium medium]
RPRKKEARPCFSCSLDSKKAGGLGRCQPPPQRPPGPPRHFQL